MCKHVPSDCVPCARHTLCMRALLCESKGLTCPNLDPDAHCTGVPDVCQDVCVEYAPCPHDSDCRDCEERWAKVLPPLEPPPPPPSPVASPLPPPSPVASPLPVAPRPNYVGEWIPSPPSPLWWSPPPSQPSLRPNTSFTPPQAATSSTGVAARWTMIVTAILSCAGCCAVFFAKRGYPHQFAFQRAHTIHNPIMIALSPLASPPETVTHHHLAHSANADAHHSAQARHAQETRRVGR